LQVRQLPTQSIQQAAIVGSVHVVCGIIIENMTDDIDVDTDLVL
jgi:hypothetical protein